MSIYSNLECLDIPPGGLLQEISVDILKKI